jgi:hypothetical protein
MCSRYCAIVLFVVCRFSSGSFSQQYESAAYGANFSNDSSSLISPFVLVEMSMTRLSRAESLRGLQSGWQVVQSSIHCSTHLVARSRFVKEYTYSGYCNNSVAFVFGYLVISSSLSCSVRDMVGRPHLVPSRNLIVQVGFSAQIRHTSASALYVCLWTGFSVLPSDVIPCNVTEHIPQPTLWPRSRSTRGRQSFSARPSQY